MRSGTRYRPDYAYGGSKRKTTIIHIYKKTNTIDTMYASNMQSFPKNPYAVRQRKWKNEAQGNYF